MPFVIFLIQSPPRPFCRLAIQVSDERVTLEQFLFSSPSTHFFLPLTLSFLRQTIDPFVSAMGMLFAIITSGAFLRTSAR